MALARIWNHLFGNVPVEDSALVVDSVPVVDSAPVVDRAPVEDSALAIETEPSHAPYRQDLETVPCRGQVDPYGPSDP